MNQTSPIRRCLSLVLALIATAGMLVLSVAKIRALDDLVKSKNRTPQHQVFIGNGPAESATAYVEKLPAKWHPLPPEWHLLPTKTSHGHSTITGAAVPDLCLFRQELLRALRR